jgi:hypothetical protein
MDLEKYRASAQKFISAMDKEYYLHFAGHKDDLNTAALYEEYADLFSTANFGHLKKLKSEASSPVEISRLSNLLQLCGEGLLENQVRDLSDEIAEQEARATLDIDGKEVSFRYSEVTLSNEPDKAKRDMLDDRRNEMVRKSFNPNLLNYWTTLHNEAKKLGFDSYRDFFSFLKSEDFEQTASQTNRLLDETRQLYEENFGALLYGEISVSLQKSRKSDFAYLRRAKKFDRYFKKGQLVPVFKDTLMAMGIDLERQHNIILDVEERKNKSPRAFCATVKVPDEIYLVVMPKGGQDDYEAMFHEGGHAQHFANVKADMDFEFKCLGDNAVTEGYAFTLEHIMQDRYWLTSFLKMPSEAAKEFLYFSNIIKLWFCRRYAGKLNYELLLHDKNPVAGKDEVYRGILNGVNMMDYSGADYLKDVDEGFYCTNYIRAWIFEAQLKDYMLRKFGNDWVKQKKAGSFLKEIWSYGQKYSPVEILKQLDYKELDIDYLINSLIEGVNNNK